MKRVHVGIVPALAGGLIKVLTGGENVAHVF